MINTPHKFIYNSFINVMVCVINIKLPIYKLFNSVWMSNRYTEVKKGLLN